MTIEELKTLVELADKFQTEYFPRYTIRTQGTTVYNAIDIVSDAASYEIEKAKTDDRRYTERIDKICS